MNILLGLNVTSHLDAHSCIAVRSELRRVDDMIGVSTTILRLVSSPKSLIEEV